MRSFIKICAIVSVFAAVALALPAANALCTNDLNYGTYPSFDGANCGDFCEITGLASADPTQLESAWWKLTLGNPAVGAGVDNGAHLDDGTGGTGGWIYGTGTGNNIIIGGGGANTNAGATDGCPDADENFSTPDFLILVVSDHAGNAAIISSTQNNTNTFQMAVGTTDIPAGPIPPPFVASSNKAGNTTTFNISSPSLAALQAIYRDNTNGAVPLSSIVTGYRVWSKTVGRNATLPADRATGSGAWTALTPAKVALGTPASVQVTCATDCDAYLGISLVFDGATPFETSSISGSPRRVQAGPTLAQPGDPDFRVIPRNPRSQRDR